MLKKLFADSFNRNKLSMILFLSAIAFFMLEYLMTAFGVNAMELGDWFMFACLFAVIACFVQGDNRKTYIAYIYALIFAFMSFFSALNFLGYFVLLCDGASGAWLWLKLFSFICYSVMFISLIVFALKKFKPNILVFIMLCVGLLGVILGFIATLILINGFTLDVFGFVLPALFILGTFFFVLNEFSDGTQIKVSVKTEAKDNAAEKNEPSAEEK